MQYKYFKARHPDYDLNLWRQCRAFYAGGKRLLGDKALMKAVFPPHLAEQSFVYSERCRRAYYIPYAGEIIDAILAALFGERVTITSEPEPPEYYEWFYEDCSPPAGRKQSLNDLLKQQLLTALLCRQAWTLIDFPSAPPGQEVQSLADEEAAGLLDAYACSIDPEMVLDWEETEDGELLWAMVLHREAKRKEVDSTRATIREEYTIYKPEGWERYAVEYKEDKPPQPADEIPMMDEGPLPFGRVPLVRLDLSDGLWAMGKILPIAIAHFNLRNALSWAELKSLFPVPVVFQAGEEMSNPITEDIDRGVNQVYGQGQIVQLAATDRMEYVGPNPAPFTAAMQDLAGLRDEMHRVLHHMALSVDNSAAALQRSAESKQIDQAATSVILRALGQIVREHAVGIYEMVQRGRNDSDEIEWQASGMERFNEQSVEALVEQAGTVDTLAIKSAHFQILWSYQLARRLLGDNADQDDLDLIREELEQNMVNEDYAPMPEPRHGLIGEPELIGEDSRSVPGGPTVMFQSSGFKSE